MMFVLLLLAMAFQFLSAYAERCFPPAWPDIEEVRRLVGPTENHLLLGVTYDDAMLFLRMLKWPHCYNEKLRQRILEGEDNMITKSFGKRIVGYDFAKHIRREFRQRGYEDFSVAQVMRAISRRRCRGQWWRRARWADIFLSHVQSEELEVTLKAMRSRSGYFRRTVFFVDYFCLKQCQNDFTTDRIDDAIRRIGHTLMVLDPIVTRLDDPHFYPEVVDRIWCVFELYCTVKNNNKLSGFLSWHGFLAADGHKGVEAVDVLHAKSSEPGDRVLVINKIHEFGVDAVNNTVGMVVQAALEQEARKILLVSAVTIISFPVWCFHTCGDPGEEALWWCGKESAIAGWVATDALIGLGVVPVACVIGEKIPGTRAGRLADILRVEGGVRWRACMNFWGWWPCLIALVAVVFLAVALLLLCITTAVGNHFRAFKEDHPAGAIRCVLKDGLTRLLAPPSPLLLVALLPIIVLLSKALAASNECFLGAQQGRGRFGPLFVRCFPGWSCILLRLVCFGGASVNFVNLVLGYALSVSWNNTRGDLFNTRADLCSIILYMSLPVIWFRLACKVPGDTRVAEDIRDAVRQAYCCSRRPRLQSARVELGHHPATGSVSR